MTKDIYIYGAGGHGKVVKDIAIDNGYNNIIFIDDGDNSHLFFEDIKHNNHIPIALGIGDNKTRKLIFNKLQKYNFEILSLVHSSAIILSNVKISNGVIIMPNVNINTDAIIQEGAILNTSCVIEHDCTIERFSHISVGALLAGEVKIGEDSFIGMGSRIIQSISIGKNNIIGAGSVVIRNSKDNQKMVGVPARSI